MREYTDLFDNWQSVIRNFGDKVPAEEPEHVFAYYTDEDYSGYALVVYFQNGKYCTNDGSHCSCHGLEDQWEPEEYTPELFKEMLDRLTPDDPSKRDRYYRPYGLSGFVEELTRLYNAATPAIRWIV